MSVAASTLVWMHSKSQGTARLVLLAIADHDGDGGAWPAIETLQRFAGGIDRRAVQRAITKLIELGELRRYIQAGGTADMDDMRRPNRYEILIECPPYCDRTKRHRDIRKPLFTLPEFGAVEQPPHVTETAPRAVEQPPKPPFNNLPRLNKEPYVLKQRLTPSEEADAMRRRMVEDPPVECSHGRIQVLCGECVEVLA